MCRFQITVEPGAFRIHRRGQLRSYRVRSFKLYGATPANTRVVMKGDQLRHICTDATPTFQPLV